MYYLVRDITLAPSVRKCASVSVFCVNTTATPPTRQLEGGWRGKMGKGKREKNTAVCVVLLCALHFLYFLCSEFFTKI